LGSRRSAAYRIPARAPTRSPQGGRARQNAAKNPADLHAGRFARASGHRPAWRASAPRASSTRSRASGEEGPPLPRPRTTALARLWRASGGAVAASGAAIPERREAERGSSVAARQRRA